MADGYGTPIRLIFDDPKAMERAGYANGMELNATSMALSVERRVGGMPMPLSKGKRFGLDLNTVNSTIIIDAVFVDDDHSRRASTARKASGHIDTTQTIFSVKAVGEKTTIPVTTYELLVGSLKLKDSLGATHSITIVSSSSTKGYVSGTNINVGTSGTGFVTAAELATAIAACINANTGTFNMTASVSASDFVPTVNGKVTITQTVNGVVSGQQNIRFKNEIGQALFTRQFAGGRAVTTDLKSAADKVQDLYGILHNTARGGSGVVATSVLGIAATIATGGAAGAVFVAGAASAAVVGAAGAEIAMQHFRGDYPIGIQIPYNSMVQAASGEKYAVRNFLIPTGKKTIDEKMSHENDKPASTTFSTDDNTTGIQGTVQKMDILYDAGEEVYMVKIVFAPIDAII